MRQRFATIWFRYLLADYSVRLNPALQGSVFAMATPDHGRLVVKAVNDKAQALGIQNEMVVADCKAIFPELKVLDYRETLAQKLLTNLGEWCIRFSPVVAVDPPDGLILETTGCTHLWGGEENYLKDLIQKLSAFGYHVRGSIAATIGTSWAVTRYAKNISVIPAGAEQNALAPLPPAALRLGSAAVERLNKLGLYQLENILEAPKYALQRRFGNELLIKLNQAFGKEPELIKPLIPYEPYRERLPCLEPVRTATAIEIALELLIDQLCGKLKKKGLGLRSCIFKTYRVDGKIQELTIGTTHASCNQKHLYKLFENKITTIEPGLGIELFILEAPKFEKTVNIQDAFWDNGTAKDEVAIAEFVDRIADRIGLQNIHRYLPAAHYWPERSFVSTKNLKEKPQTEWRTDQPRPLHLLPRPEMITVTAPIPDYPPMLFRYKGRLHKIAKADGPERIEQEWWLQQGLYRDYYCVEDEEGNRFWLFRSGDYSQKKTQWFIHGFFA